MSPKENCRLYERPHVEDACTTFHNFVGTSIVVIPSGNRRYDHHLTHARTPKHTHTHTRQHTHRRAHSLPHSDAGVDAEWKPSFGSSQNNVALLQIGLRDRVFVIDLLTLSQDDMYDAALAAPASLLSLHISLAALTSLVSFDALNHLLHVLGRLLL